MTPEHWIAVYTQAHNGDAQAGLELAEAHLDGLLKFNPITYDPAQDRRFLSMCSPDEIAELRTAGFKVDL